jgi:G1/S-specific cyclin PLC1
MDAPLTMAELNAAALDKFVYQPVNQTMIRFLADAAYNVITCDNTLMPTPITRANTAPASASTTPEPQRVQAEDGGLPTLEEFITQLVCSSNVQVPTLMSTLVYLTRLRSRLQPMARGLRCTTHRIFLAALILAAKYLNDSSPKNKHWANYSHINTESFSFGFSRTEVNLMEKQLLFLLDWDLRIRDDDLYRELDLFLAPIRDEIETKHARRMHRRRLAAEEKMRQQAAAAAVASAAAMMPKPHQHQHQHQDVVYSLPSAHTAATLYLTPPQSRDTSLSRAGSRHERSTSISTPPDLSYSSSAGTPGSATPNSRVPSRSQTPLSYDMDSYMYLNDGMATAYDPASGDVVIVDEANSSRKNSAATAAAANGSKILLPYEITPEALRDLQEDNKSKKLRRTVLGRVFSAVSVR